MTASWPELWWHRRSRRTAANNYAQPTGVVLSLKCITPPRIVGFELGYRFTN